MRKEIIIVIIIVVAFAAFILWYLIGGIGEQLSTLPFPDGKP